MEVGEPEIQNHDVRLLSFQHFSGFDAAVGREHVVPFALQYGLQ